MARGNGEYTAVHAITSGHRSISGQFTRVTDHVYTCTVRMSVQGSQVKKRSVLKTTVDKWIAENDKALSTTVWLKYDTDRADRTRVKSLKCSICTRFKLQFSVCGRLRESSLVKFQGSRCQRHALACNAAVQKAGTFPLV